MSELPLDPSLAKTLLKSDELDCSREVVIIASLLSVKSIWLSRRGQIKALEAAKSKFAVMCF